MNIMTYRYGESIVPIEACVQAQALVDLAQQRNLRLGCSPFTFMGEAQQTAWRVIRDG